MCIECAFFLKLIKNYTTNLAFWRTNPILFYNTSDKFYSSKNCLTLLFYTSALTYQHLYSDAHKIRISFEAIQKPQYPPYFLRINPILIHNTSDKFYSSKNHTFNTTFMSDVEK